MKRAICIVMLVLMGITFAQAQRLLPKKYFLPKEEFRLYYTSTSTVSQSFDVWISDSFGNEKKLTFQFNSSD